MFTGRGGSTAAGQTRKNRAKPQDDVSHGGSPTPRTQQRVRIGATAEGKLLSLQHDYIYQRSMLDAHHEDCGEATPFHYGVPNLRVTFGRAKRNIGAGADMRDPVRSPVCTPPSRR